MFDWSVEQPSLLVPPQGQQPQHGACAVPVTCMYVYTEFHGSTDKYIMRDKESCRYVKFNNQLSYCYSNTPRTPGLASQQGQPPSFSEFPPPLSIAVVAQQDAAGGPVLRMHEYTHAETNMHCTNIENLLSRLLTSRSIGCSHTGWENRYGYVQI